MTPCSVPDRRHDGSTRFSGMKPVNLWYHKERIVLDGVRACQLDDLYLYCVMH
jgi:hypothetical protein